MSGVENMISTGAVCLFLQCTPKGRKLRVKCEKAHVERTSSAQVQHSRQYAHIPEGGCVLCDEAQPVGLQGVTQGQQMDVGWCMVSNRTGYGMSCLPCAAEPTALTEASVRLVI